MKVAAIAAGIVIFAALCLMRNLACERDMWREVAHITVDAVRSMNPCGLLLDRTVWVRKYEGSRWEEATIVAVSHKGAVAVRRVGETHTFWICKEMTKQRVRLGKPEEEQ